MNKKLSDFETFIFDIDGTLLNDKKNITKQTYDALKFLKQQNKKIILCTGNPYYACFHIINELNLKYPVISCNSALIYNPSNKKLITHKTLDSKAIKNVIKYLEANKIDYLANTKNKTKNKKYSKLTIVQDQRASQGNSAKNIKS